MNRSRRLVHGDEVGGDHRGRLGEGSRDLLACFFFLQFPVNLIQIKFTSNVIISNRKFFFFFFTAKECFKVSHVSLEARVWRRNQKEANERIIWRIQTDESSVKLLLRRLE